MIFLKDGKFAILKKKSGAIRYSISEFSSTKSNACLTLSQLSNTAESNAWLRHCLSALLASCSPQMARSNPAALN
jgi:hypothetical protein